MQSPTTHFGFALRIFRFGFIILAALSGFLGLSAGLFILTGALINLKSFGASYLSPYLPFTATSESLSYILPPIWKKDKRAKFLSTKKTKNQNHISMPWKYGK